MTSQIRVGIRENMYNARFEFQSLQTNRLARLSGIEYDEFFFNEHKMVSCKEKRNQKITKTKTTCKISLRSQ